MTKLIAYFAIVHLVILCVLAGNFYFLVLMAILIFFGSIELLRAFSKNILSFSFLLVVLVYGVFAWGTILFSLQLSSAQILFVYLTIMNMDAYSQLTGQWIGKHKITPKLSPNKTFEGFLGGLVASLISTFALKSFVNATSVQAILLGLILSITSLLGDLMASWCKRQNHLKDFGSILPGHGGILDRFDSLLCSAPVFWWLMKQRYIL